jgi:hypothetical protein
MARYAPTHQLELTEEIVPLDDPPDGAKTTQPDPSRAFDHKPDAKAVVARAEHVEPGLRVIAPPDRSGATAAYTSDFDGIADGELDDRADCVPPSAPAALNGDDTENGTVARPASAQLGRGAATERWDSGGPRPWPQPLTARDRPHVRGRARALAVGLLVAVVTVLGVVVLAGHESGKPRDSRADVVTRTEPPSSPRTPPHTPTQVSQRSPRHRRARAPHRHPRHRRRPYRRPNGRHKHHRHRAQSSAPAATSSPAPAPAAPSPPPSAARSGGGTTSGGAASSGGSSSGARSSSGGGSPSGSGSSGGGGSDADPTFAGGF